MEELAIQADILRLENRLENNRHEILKWMISAMLAQSAFLFGLAAFLK